MSSLLQIAEAERLLLQAIYEADGEITPEQDKELQALALAGTQKVDNTAGLLRAWKHEIEGLKAEEALLAGRRKRLEDGLERLQRFVLYAVGEGQERRGARSLLRWRWATKRSVTPGPCHLELVPEEFRVLVPAQLKLDTVKLRARLEALAKERGDLEPVVIMARVRLNPESPGNGDIPPEPGEGEVEVARLEPPTAWLEVR